MSSEVIVIRQLERDVDIEQMDMEVLLTIIYNQVRREAINKFGRVYSRIQHKLVVDDMKFRIMCYTVLTDPKRDHLFYVRVFIKVMLALEILRYIREGKLDQEHIKKLFFADLYFFKEVEVYERAFPDLDYWGQK